MALIVNIDCATSLASVCISHDGKCIAYAENEVQKEHASFLHPALNSLLKQADKTLSDIDAFAVTHGPGSYTGLRVAMAAAKGFCVAAQKPLIAINTLQVMAHAALGHIKKESSSNGQFFLCPMIDARRAEVFTAFYDTELTAVVQPFAAIIEQSFFDNLGFTEKIFFSGDGSHKAAAFLRSGDAVVAARHTAKNLAALSFQAFCNQQFADVAYSEPLYIKDFYFAEKSKKK